MYNNTKNLLKRIFTPKPLMFNGIPIPSPQQLAKAKADNAMSTMMANAIFGLSNPVEGSGTGRAVDFYNTRNNVPYLTYAVIDQLFRSNWMARKIVETPASDMTKNWREFKFEDVEKIKQREKSEKMLDVKDTVRRAVQWADLYGGSAIILGIDDESQDMSQPLEVKNIQKGSLRYLQVVFKDQITPSTEIELDPYSIHFQRPRYYTIASTPQGLIHASRIIPFYGAELPLYSLLRQAGWGDSRLTAAWAVLEIAEKTWLNISQLISSANIDVIQIQDYLNLVNQTPQQLFARMGYDQVFTTNYKKMVLDVNDKFERKELSGIQGLANIMIQFLQMVAGAAGMPLTKLLGTSVGGFSTGDNEIIEYYDSISERQNRIYRQMNYLDKIIEVSTFGAYLGMEFEWKSLYEMTALQKSEIQLRQAQRDEINIRNNVIDAAIVASQLMHDGTYQEINQEWIDELKNNPPEEGMTDNPFEENKHDNEPLKFKTGEPRLPALSNPE